MNKLLSIAHESPVGVACRPGALESRPLRRLATAAFVLGLCTMSVVPAFALNVTPSWTEIWMNPGEEKMVTVTAINDGKEALQVDLSEKEGMGAQAHADISVEKWLLFTDTTSFIVEPGQSHDVNATVRLPKGTTSPEFSGMISMRYRTEHPSNVTPMISVPIYAFVKGVAAPAGYISNVSILSTKDRLGIMAAVKNTGNIHLRIHGDGRIQTTKGKTVQTFTIPSSIPVFSGSDRGFGMQMPWPADLTPGSYLVHFDLEASDFKLSGEQLFKVKEDHQIVMGKRK